MKHLFFNCFWVVTFFISFLSEIKAQELMYVSVEDESLLLRDGWRLQYTQENSKILSYTIADKGLAFTKWVDRDHLDIVLMDTLNQVLDSKEINIYMAGRLQAPAFYFDEEACYLGPHFNRQFAMDWERAKIKSSSDSYFRDKSIAQKTTQFKQGHRFNSFIEVTANSKKHVLTHEYLNNTDTLLSIMDSDKMLYVQAEGKPISLEFLGNAVVILCNIENKLYLFDVNVNKVVDTLNLPYSNKSRKFPDFKLEKDRGLSKLYLISSVEENGNFWELYIEEYKLNYAIKKTVTDVSMQYAKIHNDYLYNKFYLRDLRATAIYKKPLY